MSIEVGGVDHVYVTVTDLARSEAFYDGVMRLLGFKKGTAPIAGEPHRHYFNQVTQYSLRPAKRPGPHDAYAPGLHHVAWAVESRSAVDGMYEVARKIGARVLDAPADYPQYNNGNGYYAVFFADPDGLKLECVYTP